MVSAAFRMYRVRARASFGVVSISNRAIRFRAGVNQIQHVVLPRDQRLDVVPVEWRDPGGAQGKDHVVQDLVPLVLVALDLHGEMISIRVFKQFDQQSGRVRRHLGVSGKGGEEVPIGCLWAPHDAFLVLRVTAGGSWSARFRLIAVASDGKQFKLSQFSGWSNRRIVRKIPRRARPNRPRFRYTPRSQPTRRPPGQRPRRAASAWPGGSPTPAARSCRGPVRHRRSGDRVHSRRHEADREGSQRAFHRHRPRPFPESLPAVGDEPANSWGTSIKP